MTADPMMARIQDAVLRQLRGEKAEARDEMAALWEEIGGDGDPLHRCTLAHYMADLQEDPVSSLEWNERSLTAAEALSDDRLRLTFPALSVAGFMASLHLNLAEDYRQLADVDNARRHLVRGEVATSDLPEGGYGAMVRAGLARLRAALEAR
ncbi:MAG: hypothetical protein AB7O56_05320 [Bauldia sp.]